MKIQKKNLEKIKTKKILPVDDSVPVERAGRSYRNPERGTVPGRKGRADDFDKIPTAAVVAEADRTDPHRLTHLRQMKSMERPSGKKIYFFTEGFRKF